MLAFKYAFFALIATTINLLVQSFVLSVYSNTGALYIAMFFGTLLGLVVKYILDKKYIFYYITKNIVHDGQKFFIYTLMGIVTTFIFWGFELSFNAIFNHTSAKYFGAILGLSLGYFIKYHLDKRYVFKGIQCN
ncbi:MAG: GtrA family protein [Sulfurospirillaceae bacterium]|nr:GtrA family protein [Sulfurospirillaceae bacterium]